MLPSACFHISMYATATSTTGSNYFIIGKEGCFHLSPTSTVSVLSTVKIMLVLIIIVSPATGSLPENFSSKYQHGYISRKENGPSQQLSLACLHPSRVMKVVGSVFNLATNGLNTRCATRIIHLWPQFNGHSWGKNVGYSYEEN